MEVTSLGARCCIVRLHDVSIMIDCGFGDDGQTPLFDAIDVSSVNVVLVSNERAITALPLLLHYTTFSGQVYATEPIICYGRILMEEVAYYLGPEAPVNSSFSAPYSLDDIASCVARIQPLSFDEIIPLSSSLRIHAVSSSYSIGACNWIAETHFSKYSFVSASSAAIRRHTTELAWSALSDSDVLLLQDLRPEGCVEPDAMLLEMASRIERTLKQGGNVLMPIAPCGVLYDIFEFLSAYLSSKGLQQIPMFFVSSVADASIAYSGVVCEWLSKFKQNSVYDAQHPFSHDALLEQGRLSIFTDLQQRFLQKFQEPCILLAGHSSLQYGSSRFFLNKWSSDAKSLLVLTDPTHTQPTFKKFLRSYITSHDHPMRIVHAVLDARFTLDETKKLLQQCAPKHVVLPAEARQSNAFADQNTSILHFMCAQNTLFIPIENKFERGYMSSDMARRIINAPVYEVEGSVSATPIRAHISSHNGEVFLEHSEDINEGRRQNSPILVGDITVSHLLKSLEQRGIVDAQVAKVFPTALSVDEAIEVELQIDSLNARMCLSRSRTDIQTNNVESRAILTAVVLECLQSIS